MRMYVCTISTIYHDSHNYRQPVNAKCGGVSLCDVVCRVILRMHVVFVRALNSLAWSGMLHHTLQSYDRTNNLPP